MAFWMVLIIFVFIQCFSMTRQSIMHLQHESETELISKVNLTLIDSVIMSGHSLSKKLNSAKERIRNFSELFQNFYYDRLDRLKICHRFRCSQLLKRENGPSKILQCCFYRIFDGAFLRFSNWYHRNQWYIFRKKYFWI